MKIKLKKIIACTLCAVTLVSLAGCGADKQSDGATEVTIWSTNGHDKKFMTDMVKKYNEGEGKDLGVQIKYEVKTGNIADMMELAMSNGTAPDIFMGGDLQQMAEKDWIMSIEDFNGSEEFLKRFADYIMPSRHVYNGKIYTVPSSTGTYGLVYNKDMFKAAGIVDENGEAKPPKTWAEVVEDAKILTNPDKDEYGIIFPGKWSAWYETDIAKACVPLCGYISGYNPKTGTYDYTAEATAAKAIMAIKRNKSYFPNVEGLDNDPARARFAEGGIGMKFSGSYDYGVWTEQFPAKCDWGVAPYPVPEEGTEYRQHMDNGGGTFIKKITDGKDADKIFEAFKFLYSEDMIKEQYRMGMSIPINFDWVEGVEVDNSLPNKECWQAFCELTKVSKPSPIGVKSDTTGVDSFGKRFVNEIWANDLSDEEIDKIAAEWTAAKNEGIAKYKSIHPEYDASASIDPSWDATR